MKPRWTGSEPGSDVPRVKPGSKSKSQPQLNVRREIIRLTGVDVVAVEGISASLAQTILSEIGTDMISWPNEKRFGSWLGVAPRNDLSGGKVLRSRTLKTHNRAGQAFRQAASVTRSQSAFGGFYDAGRRRASAYNTHQRAHILRSLRQCAENLGFALVNRTTNELLERVVF